MLPRLRGGVGVGMGMTMEGMARSASAGGLGIESRRTEIASAAQL